MVYQLQGRVGRLSQQTLAIDGFVREGINTVHLVLVLIPNILMLVMDIRICGKKDGRLLSQHRSSLRGGPLF